MLFLARTLLASVPLAIVALMLVPTAPGQSELERLDRQIRQRNDSSVAATPPATPQPAFPIMSGARMGGPVAREPVYLGMAVDDRYDRSRGVRVVAVHPGGPAERAGLRPQDLITAVHGVPVRQMADLSEVLATFAPGQATSFDIVRGNQPKALQVTFGRRPTQPRAAIATPPPPVPQLGAQSHAGPQPTQAPPTAAMGQPEAVPPPSSEMFPWPRPAGPGIAPPKKAEPPKTPEAPKKTELQQDTRQRIEQLQRRIEELERRIAKLEQALPKPSK